MSTSFTIKPAARSTALIEIELNSHGIVPPMRKPTNTSGSLTWMPRTCSDSADTIPSANCTRVTSTRYEPNSDTAAMTAAANCHALGDGLGGVAHRVQVGQRLARLNLGHACHLGDAIGVVADRAK